MRTCACLVPKGDALHAAGGAGAMHSPSRLSRRPGERCISAPVATTSGCRKCPTSSGAAYFNVPGAVESRGSEARRSRAATTPTPSGFQRVDPATQRGRDDVRRKVLAEELATEEQLLRRGPRHLRQRRSRPAAGGAVQRRQVPASASRACASRCNCTSAISTRLKKELGNTVTRSSRNAGVDSFNSRRRAAPRREWLLGSESQRAVALASKGRPEARMAPFGCSECSGSSARNLLIHRDSVVGAIHARALHHREAALLPVVRHRLGAGIPRTGIAGGCGAAVAQRRTRHLRESGGREPVRTVAAEDRRAHAAGALRRLSRVAGRRSAGPYCAAPPIPSRSCELGVSGKAETAPHLHRFAGGLERWPRCCSNSATSTSNSRSRARSACSEQQQANRDLIRSLAHEIKNPLGRHPRRRATARGELDRPHLIEYTQVIIGEADRLQSLVNRLADAASAAGLPAHQHPRSPGARAQRRAGGVSDRSASSRFRHQPSGVRGRPRAVDAGRAQHRAGMRRRR